MESEHVSSYYLTEIGKPTLLAGVFVICSAVVENTLFVYPHYVWMFDEDTS